MDVVNAVKASTMKPYQWLIVVLCMFCNMLDGFDFFAMGFVLPYLPGGFATSTEKGLLISAGLVGMALGAMTIAPLADRFGRRRLMLVGLAFNTGSVIFTALAANSEMMLIGRFLTGLGVGTISAMIIVTAQEFSSVAKRNLAVGIVTIGFPLGSTLAGVTGVSLISAFGGAWQAMFWVAAAVSAIGFVLVLVVLPESLAFLITSDTPTAQRKIDKIAGRLGMENVGPQSAFAVTETGSNHQGSARVLGRGLREKTLLLWCGYGFLTAAYYFVGTWTPQLIADASGSARDGALAGTIISVGSLAGSIVFGLIGLKLLATRIAWIALSVSVASLVLFTLAMGGPFALVMAAILGLAVFISISSYTAMAPPMYPARARARGYGLMVGVSRIGAIVTPILAGLASSRFAPETIFVVAAIPLALSAVAAVRLWSITKADFDRELLTPATTMPNTVSHSNTATAATSTVSE